jgi:VanZ family protein
MTTPGMTFRPDLRYSLLAVMYLAGIYWLSSIPDLSTHERPLVDLAQNIGHAPLYAGLAFLVLKSGSGIPAGSWPWKAAVFLAGAACAALDEWHQSFVRGRLSSLGDFFVDLIGIGGMLAFLHWRAVRSTSGLPPGTRLAAHRQPGAGYCR